MPAVVWATVIVTPYGGWIFDLTVLLVPLVAVAARGRAAVLAAGSVSVTAVSLVGVFNLVTLFWVPLALLGVCAVARIPARGS